MMRQLEQQCWLSSLTTLFPPVALTRPYPGAVPFITLFSQSIVAYVNAVDRLRALKVDCRNVQTSVHLKITDSA